MAWFALMMSAIVFSFWPTVLHSETSSQREAMVLQMLQAGSEGKKDEVTYMAGRISLMQKVPQKNQQQSRQCNEKGLQYTKSEDYAKAALEFEKALVLNPGDAEIANNLGFAQSKLGQLDESKRTLLYTLTLAPDRVNAWAGLGYLLADLGQTSIASGAFYNAILFSPKKQATVTAIRNATQYGPPAEEAALERAVEMAKISVAPGSAPKAPAHTPELGASPSQEKRASVQQEPVVQGSSGTGFIVSADGCVLTNYHVIEGCRQITVSLSGRRLSLSSTLTDPKNDLALLKFNDPSTTHLKFRDGKSVRSGDAVVVLGFPLQQILANQPHLTTGTVSAMAGPGNDTRILQITAPVQPGNSGGPLLDMAGNVVGIVTAKLNAIKTAQLTGDLPQNVNFSINAAVVRAFLDANGVEYETANSKGKLEAAEVGDIAKKATVLIVCQE